MLERATGRPVADYLAEVLWQPMGAEADGSWSLDSEASGFEKMESGINGRARDFAALGYLFAHDGAVGGRQVVPAEWVREATANDVTTDPAAHYQYLWWVDTERPGRFCAMDNHGQVISVDPAADVVVVRMGDRYGLSHRTGRRCCARWPTRCCGRRRRRSSPGRRLPRPRRRRNDRRVGQVAGRRGWT